MNTMKGNKIIESVTGFKKDIYESIRNLIENNDVIQLKSRSGDAYVISEEQFYYYEESMELLRDLLIAKELESRNAKPLMKGNVRLGSLKRKVNLDLVDKYYNEMCDSDEEESESNTNTLKGDGLIEAY